MSRLRQLVKRTLNALLPQRWWLAQGPRHGRSIALTFDDGPHPENTARVLDHLKRFGLRATFFVVGRKAAQHPELVRRMIEEGHEVANHTYFHGEPSNTPSGQFLTEVTACQSLLVRLTGRDIDCFRPPKGKLSLSKLIGLWKLRQTVVLWNVDTRDFTFSDVSQFQKWCHEYAPASGDIVLMHDDRPLTAEGLPQLLTKICEKQLECVPISDWRRGKSASSTQLSLAPASEERAGVKVRTFDSRTASSPRAIESPSAALVKETV